MKIILYLILSLTLFASDTYVSKSNNEQKILENYRLNPIILVLDKKTYKNQIFEEESINNILEDLFKNYLGLNIVVEKESFIEGQYNKENKIFGGIFQTNNECRDILSSVPLYEEDLYVVFNDKSLDQTDFKLYKQFFDFNILTGNLKNKLTNNQSNKIKEKKYSLYSTHESICNNEKIKVSKLPSNVIGLSKEYKDLLPIVNRAIEEKYYTKINNFLKKRKLFIENKILMEALTKEEREYLKNNKTIYIGLESQQVYSYYSKEKNQYIGSVINLFKNLSEILKIEFKVKNMPDENWSKILDLFNKNKIQIIPLIKTREREEKYIFSSNLTEISLYKVGKKKSDFKNEKLKVGVLKNSFEEAFAKLYFNKEVIEEYEDYNSLNKALFSNKVDIIYTTNIENIKHSNIIIEKDKYPLVFGYNKNNYLLKNIIDKALIISEDFNTILKEGEVNKEDLLFKEKEQEKNKMLKLFLISFILVASLLAIIVRLYLKNRASKKLLIDKLTDLPNYYQYMEDVSKYNTSNFTFIKIKLNILSEINRKVGWSIGNKILIEVTNILNIALETNSKIYKVSGNKFYIMTSENNIKNKINYIKESIRKLKLKESYNFDEDIKISYYKKETLISASEIFEYLETLDEIDDEKEISVLELNNQLIKKLNRRAEIKKRLVSKELDGVYAVFQPKFDLITKKILGAEALARWQDNSLGAIYPDEFIFIAEELKRVYLIDYKIAEETLKFINKIPKIYLLSDNFRISFNISLQTFEREDFLNTIINLIEKYKINPEVLEVELTETILGLNLPTIIEKINHLKAKGIQVSIDDFTAGNSSVSLLSILPVDIIKFDKSILDRVDSNNKVATEVYKGLINIVKGSNFKIVAEGIETNEQLDFLKSHKVDIGQGYIFSKPISEIDFLKLLESK
ncbi:EAL domain-containing protein [Cetobacterium sp.]|uniref:EAL domain-containing protein n=1 Tax=Cetobacterium sp. TaxID=2071632 RepID=UPI003EE6756A